MAEGSKVQLRKPCQKLRKTCTALISMADGAPRLPGWPLAALLAALALGLPAALIWTSWSTLRAQEEQKRIYLQSRMGALAARLETMPAGSDEDAFEALAADEPALAGLVILTARRPGDGLDAVWEGRRLFQLERRAGENGEILRGAVPFHQQGRLCIAVIDLWADAADFIVQPARRNLTASAAASLALFVLSMLAWQALQARQRALLRHAELEHLARLGRLAAVLAHEIRNPLGTIKGFAQLIEEQAAPAQKALAAPIITESGRLERLVNDLLAYGRPAQPVVRQIRLRSLLDQIADSCRRGAGERLEWEPESVPEDYVMDTDPDLLKQILLNLLRNAAEAASACQEPRIMLAARARAGEVEFEIRDNGPGFSEEALRRAFEPFFYDQDLGHGSGAGHLAPAGGSPRRNAGGKKRDGGRGAGGAASAAARAGRPGRPSAKLII